MKVLEFCNQVLALCGEQPLATTAGNIGALLRSCIQTSLYHVAQQTRAACFEQMLMFTATNDDFQVSIGQLPDDLVQITYTWLDTSADYVPLIPLHYREYHELGYGAPEYTYSTVGKDVFLNGRIARPAFVRMRGLVAPVLPTADDSELTIPSVVLQAVAHNAAAIFLVSYIDDANAAAVQQRIADTLIGNVRVQYGQTRGKQYNIGNNNGAYIRSTV